MSSSPEMCRCRASLNSVLSTGELETRPSRAPDYQTENRALLDIARHMADSPRTTLQKLAEVAMEICRAGSAGVSLLSPKNGDFYWPAIAGHGSRILAGVRRATSDRAAWSSIAMRRNCSHIPNFTTLI